MSTKMCVAGGVVLCIAGMAGADVISIQSDQAGSTEGLGAFTGTISYIPSIESGQLTIALTNTSPAANGGLITGFVFNIDSQDATATLMDANHPFVGLALEPASPFGTFDAGAALGGSWLGGGSPQAGIAVGQTGTFTFSVDASDAATLGASSFLSGSNSFVVRFRGFADGGSDKVPAVVPAPGAVTLCAIGALLLTRRRR